MRSRRLRWITYLERRTKGKKNKKLLRKMRKLFPFLSTFMHVRRLDENRDCFFTFHSWTFYGVVQILHNSLRERWDFKRNREISFPNQLLFAKKTTKSTNASPSVKGDFWLRNKKEFAFNLKIYFERYLLYYFFPLYAL